MTKIQIRFKLQRPLDDTLLLRLAEANAVYGIHHVTLAPSMDGLMVEYDATRLKPADVEAALAGAGIPAIRE